MQGRLRCSNAANQADFPFTQLDIKPLKIEKIESFEPDRKKDVRWIGLIASGSVVWFSTS